MFSIKFFWLVLVVQLHNCKSQEIKVEEITSEDQRVELGEGPHWDIASQSLYYVDILGPAIFRYDYKSGDLFKATVKDENSPIGFITPIEGTSDEFIIGAGRRLLVIKWNGRSSQATVMKALADIDSDQPGNRINDGKADPRGVLCFGSMGDESKFDLSKTRVGTLYNFNNVTGLEALKAGVGISNGLTWDVKRRKFYYIDSVTRDIKQFDYNALTSEISNESVLIDLDKTHPSDKFVADGMTIDSNGTLYVATWGGSRIINVDPLTKEIIREISMPTAQITSLAFGGPKLNILYVTSAGKPSPQPAPAGGLFKITGLGSKGIPMANFKLY